MSSISNAMSSGDGLLEKLVDINRVTKVVKGGRIFGFSVLAVIGDGDGRIGMGRGKAREVPAAIQKALERARADMFRVPLNDGTLYYAVTANHGAAKVYMQAASPGTGIIAGGAMRAMFEVLGVRDVLAKSFGSRNPINVVRATCKGLRSIVSPEEVAVRRGKPISEFQHVAAPGGTPRSAPPGSKPPRKEKFSETAKVEVSLKEKPPEAVKAEVSLKEESPEAVKAEVSLEEKSPETAKAEVSLKEESPEAVKAEVPLEEKSSEAVKAEVPLEEKSSEAVKAEVPLEEKSPEAVKAEVPLETAPDKEKADDPVKEDAS